MKNITNLYNVPNVLFCETPHGASYYTCPFCYGYNFEDYDDDLIKEEFEIEKKEENRLFLYPFCDKCKIVYDVGCYYTVLGCTDSVYNAHLVKKWKYKDIIYDGMPLFDDADEWIKNLLNIEILELYCPNNGARGGNDIGGNIEHFYGCSL